MHGLPIPFASKAIDGLILKEFGRLFSTTPHVTARRASTDSSAPARFGTTTLTMTSGTAFVIGGEPVDELFGG
jgi:hypothetical protein